MTKRDSERMRGVKKEERKRGKTEYRTMKRKA
jgi:hypothetical protein